MAARLRTVGARRAAHRRQGAGLLFRALPPACVPRSLVRPDAECQWLARRRRRRRLGDVPVRAGERRLGGRPQRQPRARRVEGCGDQRPLDPADHVQLHRPGSERSRLHAWHRERRDRPAIRRRARVVHSRPALRAGERRSPHGTDAATPPAAFAPSRAGSFSISATGCSSPSPTRIPPRARSVRSARSTTSARCRPAS